MKKWMRLAGITTAGLAAMFGLTLLLRKLEKLLLDHGVEISERASIAIFFLVLGGAYGLVAQLALKEIQRVRQGEGRAR